MTRYKRPTENTSGSGSQFQTLALFIILLSFFIVLNSISTFEDEKIKPVLQSIEATFADRVIRKELAPSVTEDPAQATGNGTVYDHLEALFQSQFKKLNPSLQIDEEKGIFYTTIPYEQLERAILDTRPHHLSEIKKTGPFISLLKSLMLDSNNNLRLDIIVYASPEELIALSRNVSVLLRHLEQQGVPTQRMNVGLSDAPEETENNDALLIIRLHKPYPLLLPKKIGGTS